MPLMHSPARRALVVLKYGLAAAVVVGVALYFYRVLTDPAFQSGGFVFRWEYLVLAGLLYLLTHTLWGTFWWQLLLSQGASVSWQVAMRAYYISQLGKYVPGKVWVIVLRMGLLGGVVPRRVVAITGVYETLTSMAAGAVIGAALFPYLAGGQHVIPGGAIALCAVALVPLLAVFLNRFAAKVLAKRKEANAPALPVPPVWLLALGLLQASVGWCLLALSLGLVIRGTAPAPPEWTSTAFVQELAATTVMYVAGFVVLFAPGGVGARELVLQQALTPVLRPLAGEGAVGLAAAIALMLRLVWTVAELVMIGIVSSFKKKGSV
jgi:glycosyltransferase 2 family protein